MLTAGGFLMQYLPQPVPGRIITALHRERAEALRGEVTCPRQVSGSAAGLGHACLAAL